MTMNDPLANTLSHLMNTERLGKRECIIGPYARLIEEVLTIFRNEGYIGEVSVIEDGKGKMFKVMLLGRINKCNVIKPRYNVKKDDYLKFEKRYLPAKNFGLLIVSTPNGIMKHDLAKEQKTGGKLLAYCY